MPEITSFTSFKIYVKNIRCQLKNVQDEIHNFKNMGWGSGIPRAKALSNPWLMALPALWLPPSPGGKGRWRPRWSQPWLLPMEAAGASSIPPSRLQNRKQEPSAACWGAPLLHVELNCLCISGRADTGLVNVRDRPAGIGGEGEPAPGQGKSLCK